ncbi:MAG TPA: glycosyltransferase [Anaerolineae bacterium]|nr:glycosyltransferase [Anaerolineae bacterium]
MSGNKFPEIGQAVRILHVIDHLDVGGAQVLLQNLCVGQTAIDKTVTQEIVALYGEGSYAASLRRAGISVTSLAATKTKLVTILRGLRAVLHKGKYDLLDLHLPVASVFGTLLSPWQKRPRTIVNVHALKAQIPAPFFYQFRLIASRVDRFVVFLPNSQHDLRTIGIGESKICFIPMGLDFRRAAPERHREIKCQLATQYHFDIAQPLLLSVARLAADRQIHVLVEAMARIAAVRPDAILLMVGEGDARAQLETIVKANGIERNVIFAGKRLDGWNLFPGCDVYLSMCGGCRIGVAAFEAMACERAVVAHNIDPMERGECVCREQGVFIAARDADTMAQAVLNLLGDPNRAQRLGRQARENVLRQLSLEAMVRRYNALYRELVGGTAV